MAKQAKTEYFHFRMTPSMKEKLYVRAAELGKEPSVYLTELMEKDLAGYDLDESEKPRMKEFSKQVGMEIFNKITSLFDSAYLKTKNREEKLLALLILNYRQTLYQFQNIINRDELSNKLSAEQVKICEEKTRKNLNEIFDKYLEFVLINDSENIIEHLKKPVK
jgi:predicted DNA-binding protein